MTKENAVKIITSCAKEYQHNLENKNILFIFATHQKTDYFESSFLDSHFYHLTGVDMTPQNKISAAQFYQRSLKSLLHPHDIILKPDGTTVLKLTVLPQLMQIHKSAKMIGDYNFSKSFLFTDKIAGSISACLGFIRNNNYYIPNTALKEDVRNLTNRPQQKIVAIFSKHRTETLYSTLCYLGKGITIETPSLQDILHEKVDLLNLTATFPIPHQKAEDSISVTESTTPPIQPVQSHLSIAERITQAKSKQSTACHSPPHKQNPKR